jgi:hypothetical protein
MLSGTIQFGKQKKTSPLTGLQTTLVYLDKFKHCQYRSGRQADLGKAFVQPLRPGIAPAALGHERIPHLDLLIVRLAAMLERPREQLRIGLVVLEHLCFERGVALPRFGGQELCECVS